MIVLGIIFRCLDAMMILGAAGTERSIFVNPLGKKRESLEARHPFSQNSESDHITFLNAYRMMRDTAAYEGSEAAEEIAHEYFIHYGTFKNIEATTREIERVLVAAGLIPYSAPADRYNNELGDRSVNETSSNSTLIKALLTASSPTNLAIAISPHRLRTASSDLPTVIHPASIKGLKAKANRSKLTRNDLYMYNAMSKSNDGKHLFLRDVSPVSPLTAILFGEHLQKKGVSGPARRTLELNKWLPLLVKGEHDAPKILLKYRAALDQVLSSTFQDLSSRRRTDEEEEREGDEREYLADDSLRAFFVDGVVDLLDRDAAKRTNQEAEVSDSFRNSGDDIGLGPLQSFRRVHSGCL